MKSCTPSPTVLALVWNSMQATRSPRSMRLACSFSSRVLPDRLEVGQDDGAGPRRQRLVLRLPGTPGLESVGLLLVEVGGRPRRPASTTHSGTARPSACIRSTVSLTPSASHSSKGPRSQA